MAILISCYNCKRMFSTSVESDAFCDDCNGNNAARQKEAERFQALSTDEKIMELLERVKILEQSIGHTSWPIG